MEIVSKPPHSPGQETEAHRGAVPAQGPHQVISTHLALKLLDPDPEGWVGSAAVTWWDSISKARR